MPQGERVCKRVGGRDDTEIIGRKEFFGAGGAKRGKHKEKFLSSKGIEGWIVPSHGLFASPPGFEHSFHSAPLE